MALLSKSAISAVGDLERVTVAVPEWGGEVLLQVPKVSEFEAWDTLQRDDDGEFITHGARASLVAICLVDEAGERLFTGDEVAQLSQKSWAVIDRLFEQCKKLTGASDDEIEETEKN